MLSRQGIQLSHPHHAGCNQTDPPPLPPSVSAERTPAQTTGLGAAAGMTAGIEKVPAAGTDPQSSTTPSMSLQTGPGQQPHMETDQYAAAEKMIELLWMSAMATGQGPEMLIELLMETGSAPGAQKGGFMGTVGHQRTDYEGSRRGEDQRSRPRDSSRRSPGPVDR